jgi:hypothetical protein
VEPGELREKAAERQVPMGELHSMQWRVAMDGPWSPAAARKFRDQGYDGLTLVPGRDWVPADRRTLDLLPERVSVTMVTR